MFAVMMVLAVGWQPLNIEVPFVKVDAGAREVFKTRFRG